MAGSTFSNQHRVSVASDAFSKRLWPLLIKSALGAVVAGCVLAAGQAQAIVVKVGGSVECPGESIEDGGCVEVGGQDYEVTTFTGSYNDNVSKFNTLENGGSMPWWGRPVGFDLDPDLRPRMDAEFFASKVGTLLGTQEDDAGVQVGPYFAVESSGSGETQKVLVVFFDTIVGVSIRDWNAFEFPEGVFSSDLIWAQASLVAPVVGPSAASVPGPLPIFGLAAAFYYSRKLKNRINLNRIANSVPASPNT